MFIILENRDGDRVEKDQMLILYHNLHTEFKRKNEEVKKVLGMDFAVQEDTERKSPMSKNAA